MTLQTVTVRCSECQTETTVPWETFRESCWSKTESCSCCEVTEVTVTGSVTCSSCGRSVDVRVF